MTQGSKTTIAECFKEKYLKTYEMPVVFLFFAHPVSHLIDWIESNSNETNLNNIRITDGLWIY